MINLFKSWKQNRVIKNYINAGCDFGDAISYCFMGECSGFERLYIKWKRYEKKYAELGFRTISLDRFIQAGGYGVSLDDCVKVVRQENEQPVFHAEIYVKLPPAEVIVSSSDDKCVIGSYNLPSTECKN